MNKTRRRSNISTGDEAEDAHSISPSSSSSSVDDSGIDSNASIDTCFLNYSASLAPDEFLCSAFLQLDHAVLMRDVCGRDWSFSGSEKNGREEVVQQPVTVEVEADPRELAGASVAPASSAPFSARENEASSEIGLSLGALSSMRERATELGTWSDTTDPAAAARSRSCIPSVGQFSVPPTYSGVASSQQQLYATATIEDLVKRITGNGNGETRLSASNPNAAKDTHVEFSFLLHDIISLAIQAEEKVTSLRRLVRTHAHGTGRVATPSREQRDRSTSPPPHAFQFHAVVRQWALHLHRQEMETSGASARKRSMQQHKWMSHLLVDCARYAHHVIRMRDTSPRNSLIRRCVSQPLYQLLPTPLLRHTSFMEETLRIMRWLKTWDLAVAAAGTDTNNTGRKENPKQPRMQNIKKKTQKKQRSVTASKPISHDPKQTPRRGRPPKVKQAVDPSQFVKSTAKTRIARRSGESSADDSFSSDETDASSSAASSSGSDVQHIERSSSDVTAFSGSESTSSSSQPPRSKNRMTVNVRKIRNAAAKPVSNKTIESRKPAKRRLTVNGKRLQRKAMTVSSESSSSSSSSGSDDDDDENESDASHASTTKKPKNRGTSACDVSSDEEAVVCVPASRQKYIEQPLRQDAKCGAVSQPTRVPVLHSASTAAAAAAAAGLSEDAGAYDQDWLRELDEENASPAADDGAVNWLRTRMPCNPFGSTSEEAVRSDQPRIAVSGTGVTSQESSAYDSPVSTTSPLSPPPGPNYPAAVGRATGTDDSKETNQSARALCYDEFGNRFSRRLAEKEAKYRDMLAMQERERRSKKGYFGASTATAHDAATPLASSGWNGNSPGHSTQPVWPYGGVAGDENDTSTTDVTNIAVIGGLSGVGKTAAVYLAAHLMSFRVIEMNNSVRRTPKNIETLLAEVTQSKRLHGLQALTSRSSADSLVKVAGQGGKRPRTVEDLLEEAKATQQRAQKERRRRILMASPLAMLFKGSSSQASPAAAAAAKISASPSSSANSAPATISPAAPLGAPAANGKLPEPITVAPRTAAAVSKPKRKGNAISANALASFFSSSSKKSSSPVAEPIVPAEDVSVVLPPETNTGSLKGDESTTKPFEVDVESVSTPDSIEDASIAAELSVCLPKKISVDDCCILEPLQSTGGNDSGNGMPSKREETAQSTIAVSGKDGERAGTLVLFESADVVLADESSRALYAAIRELAGKSKVPILVTSSANDAESCLRSPAQVAQCFGKKTPYTTVGNLPLHCVYLELLLIASIEFGIVRTAGNAACEAADAAASPLSNLCVCDHDAFIRIAKRLLTLVFFPTPVISEPQGNAIEPRFISSLPFSGGAACSSSCVQRPLHDGDIRQWLNVLHWMMLAESGTFGKVDATAEKGRGNEATRSADATASENKNALKGRENEQRCAEGEAHAHEWIVKRVHGMERNAYGTRSNSYEATTLAVTSDDSMDWVDSCVRQSCVDAWHGRAAFACEESDAAAHTCSRRFHNLADFSGDTRECMAHHPVGANHFFAVSPQNENEERSHNENSLTALRHAFFPLKHVPALPSLAIPITQKKNSRGRRVVRSNAPLPPSSEPTVQPLSGCRGSGHSVCTSGLDAGADTHGEYRFMTQQQLWENITFHWTVEGRVEVLTECPSISLRRHEYVGASLDASDPTSCNQQTLRTGDGARAKRKSAKENGGTSPSSPVGSARKLMHAEPQPTPAVPLHPLWSILGSVSKKGHSNATTCDVPDPREVEVHPGRVLQAQQRVRQQEFTYWLERQRGGSMLGCMEGNVGMTGHSGLDSVHKLFGSIIVPEIPLARTSDEKVWKFLLGKSPPWAELDHKTRMICIDDCQSGDFDCFALSTVRDHLMRQVAHAHAQRPEVGPPRVAGNANAGDLGSLSLVEKDTPSSEGGLDGASGVSSSALNAPPLTVAGGTKSFTTLAITRRQRQEELLTWRWRRRAKRSETLKGIANRTALVFEDVVSFACILTSEPPVQRVAVANE